MRGLRCEDEREGGRDERAEVEGRRLRTDAAELVKSEGVCVLRVQTGGSAGVELMCVLRGLQREQRDEYETAARSIFLFLRCG